MIANTGHSLERFTTLLQVLCPRYHNLTRLLGPSTCYNVTMNGRSAEEKSGVRHKITYGGLFSESLLLPLWLVLILAYKRRCLGGLSPSRS